MSISIRISDEAYNVIVRVSKESGIPLKRALETAVLEHYNEQKSLPQRIAKLEEEMARLAVREALQRRISTNSRG
jgi:hypothetical protein